MQYIWLIWSLLLLVIWAVIYFSLKTLDDKKRMLVVSFWTSLTGLTEPLFVPEYWSPPSLFNLNMLTGFDIESIIWAFGVGGIAVVVYSWIFRVSEKKMFVSAFLFFCIYFVYFLTLIAMSPGYVERVWNLEAISGILILGIPLEELLFALSFGFMWSSVYEHLTWRRLKN